MTEAVQIPFGPSPLRQTQTQAERSRIEHLRGLLIAAVAGLLGLEQALVDPDRPLIELGVSSREAMGLVGELQEHLGREIDPMTIWRAPTITALSERLARQPVAVLTAAPETNAPETTDPADIKPEATEPADIKPETTEPADIKPAAPTDRRIDHAEARSHDQGNDVDPVAVVGLGCRLPGGVNGPEAFWQQLIGGRDTVGAVPAGRWEQFEAADAAAETAIAQAPREGGFLADLAGFDAEHFGISPREAQLMDPQQRILLEVSWEALAHAGISPAALAGTATGVWVGMSTSEYSRLTMADLSMIDAWSSTGSALSIAANRLSYLLDLRGPSVTLDSACSSSLVAVQHAVQAIRAGDIDTALVGGANLLLTPAVTMSFHRAGALAPDGRCKPFAAGADGIGRAEAVAVVVLKRLSRAIADGDRVLAVIRSAEVNSDGRSNGITAPNPGAQEDLLRKAYSAADLDPAMIDYVEAHGTGTLLGDPIEANALGAVLGAGRRPDRPLLIGSAKSNLGHAEAAAGVVGLIKVVLGLQHGLIPASLHATQRNPEIQFQQWNLELVTRLRSWPRYDGAARAGVSAFGFGGTNAHVVLEEWTPPKPALVVGNTVNQNRGSQDIGTQNSGGRDDVVTLILSGNDEARLRDQAAALADHLSRPAARSGDQLRDLAHTLARRWQPGNRRAVLAARGRWALIDRLRTFAEQPAAATRDVVSHFPAGPGGANGDAVWVFSGYGSQWPAMGARLLEDEPAFAAAVDDLTPLLREATGLDLRAVIDATAPAPAPAPAPAEQNAPLGVGDAQVAIFGLQLALARLWQAHGHRPAAIIGHSLGEVAAAVVSGALDLADGVQVIALRSRLLERAAAEAGATGAMALIDLSDAEVAALAADYPGVSIAVHASPQQCTVAGPAPQVRALAEHVESLGRNAWVLTVDGAGHSPVVDPVLAELAAGLAGLRPRPPHTRLYGTVLEDPRLGAPFDGGYWAQNVRRPVRFAQAVAAAGADGFGTFVEVSPHPVTTAAIRATLVAAGGQATVLGTLRRRTDDTVTFRTNLAGLATAPGYQSASGAADDPEGLGIPIGRHADLPAPVWRHTRHWMPPLRSGPSRSNPSSTIRPDGGHRLLGTGIELPGDGAHAFAADLGLDALPWLGDHRVHGTAVLPAAAYVEIGLAAAAVLFGTPKSPAPSAELELTELELHRLLTLGPSTAVTTTTSRRGDGAVQIDVHARTPGSTTGPLIRHATMTVRRISEPIRRTALRVVGTEPQTVLRAAQQRWPMNPRSGTAVDVYAGFAAAGHRYGPAFSGITEADLICDDAGGGDADGDTVVARVVLPAAAGTDAAGRGAERFTVHPALLDACLQALAPAVAQRLTAQGRPATVAYLPSAIGSLRVAADPHGGGWCEATVHPTKDGTGLVGRIRLRADDGTELLRADDILLRPLAREAIAVPLAEKSFALTWQPADLPAEANRATAATENGVGTPSNWLVAGASELAVTLTRRLGPDVSHWSAVADAGTGSAEIANPPGDLGAVLVADLAADPTNGRSGQLVSDLATAIRTLLDLQDGARRAALARGVPAHRPPALRVWIVTQGAAAIGNRPGEPGLAALRALIRVLAFEHPTLHCSLVDLDADVTPGASTARPLEDLLAELHSGSLDDEVAWRDGRRCVRRLTRVDPAVDPELTARPLRPGAYLITGGLGGLGLVVARRLAERGAGRIVLAGRSAKEDLRCEPVRQLAALGAQIVVVRADVSDPDDVGRMIAAATRDGVPLRGVVHAAGVLDDELVADLSHPALQRVWAPKVLGGWNLHQATKDLDLDLWCVFSSAAALLGSPGQAGYATANAWLDALVELRRSQGLPGTSIGWGAWSGAGGADLGGNRLLEAITVAEGVEALDHVLAGDRPYTGVVRLDVEQMAALLPEVALRPFFAALRAGHDDQPDNALQDADLGDDWIGSQALRTLEEAAARLLLSERLARRVADILGYRAEQLDHLAPLTSLGVDSLMAVRAKNAVESDFGLTLPVRLLLQGASLADLEQHLLGQLGFEARPATEQPEQRAQSEQSEQPAQSDESTQPEQPAHAEQLAHAEEPAQLVVGPRDATERWLTSVWKQALGHNGFGVTTALTPLIAQARPGISEAVAAELLTRLGADLDVERVVCLATIERQADLVRDRMEAGGGTGQRAGSPLRVLRAGSRSSLPGEDPALFLFHPAGGSTSVYHPMLSLMPTDLPVYGLDRIESARTIEEKAAQYLELIRRVRPHGPYRLGGWSLGGALAYEVAGRLTAAGDDVDLVVLIDSILLGAESGADERAALRARFVRFVEHIRDTYDVPLPLDVDYVVGLPEDAQVKEMMAALGTALPGVGKALLEHQRTSYIDARVAEQYRAAPYAGRVLLYRATDVGLTSSLDPRYARTDDALGWDLLCPRLEVVRVPGDHTSIIDRPGVDVIAAHLSEVLRGLTLTRR